MFNGSYMNVVDLYAMFPYVLQICLCVMDMSMYRYYSGQIVQVIVEGAVS